MVNLGVYWMVNLGVYCVWPILSILGSLLFLTPQCVYSVDLGIPYNIGKRQQMEKNHNKGFVFPFSFPKSKEWVFTLMFRHHHKMFSSVIKILGPFKTPCDQNMCLKYAWIQLRRLLLPDHISFTKVWISQLSWSLW